MSDRSKEITEEIARKTNDVIASRAHRIEQLEAKCIQLQESLGSVRAENKRLQWQINFICGKDAGLVNAAAWAWKKHQESGEGS